MVARGIAFSIFETLISLDLLKLIEFGGFSQNPCKLYIQLPAKSKTFLSKAISVFRDEKVSMIQILPRTDESFLAYINQDFTNPIRFNLKKKPSQILFLLASGKQVKRNAFRSAFDYIQGNPRFRLFTQSQIKHHKLLDVFEEDIVIAKGIKIYLMDESDLPKSFLYLNS